MHLRRAIFAVLGAILLAPGIHPQDSVTTPGEEIPTTGLGDSEKCKSMTTGFVFEKTDEQRTEAKR
jgi:hypothetical protein